MGARGRASRFRVGRLCTGVATLALLAWLGLPEAACATPLDDFADWGCGLIRQGVVWLAANMGAMVAGMTGSLSLDVPIQALFGAEGSASAYAFALNVMNGVVKPLAGTVLAFCLVTELLKVAERSDASQTLPGVRQVASVVLYFAVFSLLIDHADAVCVLIYEVGRTVLGGTAAAGGVVAELDVAALEAALGSLGGNVWAHVVALVDMGVAYVFMALAWVVSLFAVWGRALQIYVYLMFAPLPIALLGAAETRQMGVGYLKNFAAACLAASVMMFVMYLFPILFNSVMAEYAAAWLSISSGDVGVLGATVELVALCVLLVFALVKSGQFARDALGG